MNREWIVVSQKYPQGLKINSAAVNWGDLCSDLVRGGASPEGMRCKIKASATEYADASALLPVEVAGVLNVVYMTPFKTKSGYGKNA